MENKLKNKMDLTKEQAQRFCDPIIDFLLRNPEIAKKITKEIEEVKQNDKQ
ncbi:hypothetical protein P3F89_27460 (plasmid) [Bacillus tropicus]|uniref:Uncharacterized protein n=1 Tax=Bacillus tropicus TaxID=2026188 RepID=A0ABD8A173_9BACI|nr:hypothetical protein [Bacillus tropicus]WMY18260.1 hypothetical protein P3F89_27460 [Bacillus tropicus]